MLWQLSRAGAEGLDEVNVHEEEGEFSDHRLTKYSPEGAGPAGSSGSQGCGSHPALPDPVPAEGAVTSAKPSLSLGHQPRALERDQSKQCWGWGSAAFLENSQTQHI